MRLEYSIRNLLVAWIGQAASVVMTFVTLSVFNIQLGHHYIDVQSLFMNVLTILSLSELGIGMAITYALYKPLADKDEEGIRSLMHLFRRAYITIGAVLIIIGAMITPFIQHLINSETDLPIHELQLYFFCFVLNSGISYFFSYKGALIIADQKKYLVSMYQYGFQILMSGAQIVLLLLTQNYLLFLICMILATFLQNFAAARKADKLYPFIKRREATQPIDKETLSGIKKNIFALVLHRIAGIAATPASTLIINASVGTASVGAYAMNNQIVLALARIMDQAFDAIIASVGNLAVKESSERQFEIFKTTFFINALLYTITAIPLLCVIDIFIGDIWLDPSYVFSQFVTALIVFLYFLKGLRSAALSFTSAYGLYWQTKWKAVIESAVLIALCLVLVTRFEIAGVVIAGMISSLFISTIYEGFMMFKHGLKQSSRWYFLRFALYILVALVLGVVAYLICLQIPLGGVGGFIVKGIVSLILAAAGFIGIFCRTYEFKEFRKILIRLIQGLKLRSQEKEGSEHHD